MSRSFDQVNANRLHYSNQSKIQFILISGSLIGINIALMIFVGMYWLNPAFHTFLTGKPF